MLKAAAQRRAGAQNYLQQSAARAVGACSKHRQPRAGHKNGDPRTVPDCPIVSRWSSAAYDVKQRTANHSRIRRARCRDRCQRERLDSGIVPIPAQPVSRLARYSAKGPVHFHGDRRRRIARELAAKAQDFALQFVRHLLGACFHPRNDDQPRRRALGRKWRRCARPRPCRWP